MKQSSFLAAAKLDCFAALAMTDVGYVSCNARPVPSLSQHAT
jgi:hypothetical protein